MPAIKQPIKVSEARILIYLHQVADPLKTPGRIATKLDMAESRMYTLLNAMIEKKWVYKKSFPLHTYYFIGHQAPVKAAKKLLEA